MNDQINIYTISSILSVGSSLSIIIHLILDVLPQMDDKTPIHPEIGSSEEASRCFEPLEP